MTVVFMNDPVTTVSGVVPCVIVKLSPVVEEITSLPEAVVPVMLPPNAVPIAVFNCAAVVTAAAKAVVPVAGAGVVLCVATSDLPVVVSVMVITDPAVRAAVLSASVAEPVTVVFVVPVAEVPKTFDPL